MKTGIGELKSEQVTKQHQLQIGSKWDMECRRVVHMAVKVLTQCCESVTQCQGVQSQKDSMILGDDEHLELYFPVLTERKLVWWICIQLRR